MEGYQSIPQPGYQSTPPLGYQSIPGDETSVLLNQAQFGGVSTSSYNTSLQHRKIVSSAPTPELESKMREEGIDPHDVEDQFNEIPSDEDIDRMNHHFEWRHLYGRFAGSLKWGRRFQVILSSLLFIFGIVFAAVTKFQVPGLVFCFVAGFVVAFLSFWCYLLPEFAPRSWFSALEWRKYTLRRTHYYFTLFLMPAVLFAGAASVLFSPSSSGSDSTKNVAGTGVGCALIWLFSAIQIGILSYARVSFYVDGVHFKKLSDHLSSEALGDFNEKVATNEVVAWPPYVTFQWACSFLPAGIVNNLLLTSHRIVLVRRNMDFPDFGVMQYSSRWVKNSDGITLSTETCNCLSDLWELNFCLCCHCLGIPAGCYICCDRSSCCFRHSSYYLPSDPNVTLHKGRDLMFPTTVAQSYTIRSTLLAMANIWKTQLTEHEPAIEV